MSRWAIILPMVARRSPATTTPPGKVAATMVVRCQVGGGGAVEPAPRTGEHVGRHGFGEVGERGRAGLQEGRRETSAVERGGAAVRGRWTVGHCPPFCTKERTNSSALLSRTESISSSKESTSAS